jgi:hypothetical protein
MRFFLLTLFLAACSTAPHRDFHFLENPAEFNDDGQKILTPAQVAYDIEQTVYALDTAYSGRQFLPKAQFPTLRQEILKIRGPLMVRDLCLQLDTLMDHVSDNHLTASFPDKPCFHNHVAVGKVGDNFYKEVRDIPWSTRLVRHDGSVALEISIANFPKSTSPVWKGFLDSVRRLVGKAHLVVIDLRGNPGGDDSKGVALAAVLAGAPVQPPYNPQWNSYRPETYQLFVNTYDYFLVRGRKVGRPMPKYIAQLKQEFVTKRDLSLMGQTPPLGEVEAAPGQDFNYSRSIQKPIYVLIDGRCASSCESTTDYLSAIPLVKTVGERTAGYIHFGNNGNVVLRNSGIVLQMAVSYNSYRDGRFLEKIGLTPQIAVPPGSNAMDAAWTDFSHSKTREDP